MPPDALSESNFIRISRRYHEDAVLPAFRDVLRAAAPVSRFFRVAGLTINVRSYAGQLDEKFSRALCHAEVPPADADVVVHAWDTVSTGVPLTMPWTDALHRSDAHIARDFFGTYIAGEGTINVYDPASRTAYFWIPDAAKIPGWVAGAPVRTILAWFLSSRKIQLAHGAAVGAGGKAALITAPSGSGKSTTSASCIVAGMEYLGDDYVAVECADEPFVHMLYSSAKLVPDTAKLFPELDRAVWRTPDIPGEKTVLFLAEAFPAQVRCSAPLSAILVPRIVPGGTTRIIPASKRDALLALAPTTLLQLPMLGPDTLAAFRVLVEKVPCFALELGPDIRGVPAVIREFIESGPPPALMP